MFSENKSTAYITVVAISTFLVLLICYNSSLEDFTTVTTSNVFKTVRSTLHGVDNRIFPRPKDARRSEEHHNISLGKTQREIKEANLRHTDIHADGLVISNTSLEGSRDNYVEVTRTSQTPLTVHNFTKCVKQIQYFITPKFRQLRVQSGQKYTCPQKCDVQYIESRDYSKLSSSDAVIIHHRLGVDWNKLSRNRPRGQIWIYATLESPVHSHKAITPHPSNTRKTDGRLYNWTMTYHSDSDIPSAYGLYVRGAPEVSMNDSRNWASGKTNIIAWMASNCGVTTWGRKKFVKALQKYMPVDTYGACGKLKCPRNAECDRIISSHKFYLALENSECPEYMTEKLWKNAYLHNCVPVVYGPSKADYEKLTPPNSFIHLEDFNSVKEVADYLKLVSSNDTLYNRYFEWKKEGSVQEIINKNKVITVEKLCKAAEKLQAIKPGYQTEGLDMYSKWIKTCQHKKLFPFE